MEALRTPGLYRQSIEPVRAVGPLARGDIPVFLGYARRGPVAAPVRIQSLRQFEELFGPALEHGFLWHSAKGFFETGGQAAYVIRVAAGAQAAETILSDGAEGAPGAIRWQAQAAFPWARIDPKRLNRAERSEAAAWIGLYGELLRREGPQSPDPGVWGNGLSLVIRRAARARTEALPGLYEDGFALRLASLAGLERASVLELSQAGPGGTILRRLQPRDLDIPRGLVRLAAPLPEFDSARALRVTSVEFDLEIHRDGQLEEQFAALAPDPAHSAPLGAVAARALTLAPVPWQNGAPLAPAAAAAALEAVEWSDPANWPGEGSFALQGGTDGLSENLTAAYRAALAQVARIPDGAMIAAPDLVLPPRLQEPGEPVPATAPDCATLDPLPLGQIRGQVLGTTEAGDPLPLAQVTVTAPGAAGQVTTDPDGGFAIGGLPLGFVTLRLSRDGYEPLEYRVQPSPFASAPAVEITLARITIPQALSLDQVAELQALMADPGHVGPYKLALLDPVAADQRIDDLLAWRARLGDLPRAGFFAPWLRVGPGEGLALPPSGHICGAFAAAERAGGIQRTGANQPLRYLEGLTLGIEDRDQAGLNPVGINAIRAFPGRGIRAHGSRGLGADPALRFLTTRRVLDAIEKSLERVLHWMVFEPNNLMTRQAVALSARSFLERLWRAGVLAGEAPEAGFTVKCDADNNPAESRDQGLLVVDIGVAPAEPYEFVLLRLGAEMDAVKVTERGA